jgi:hypothetical protein
MAVKKTERYAVMGAVPSFHNLMAADSDESITTDFCDLDAAVV